MSYWWDLWETIQRTGNTGPITVLNVTVWLIGIYALNALQVIVDEIEERMHDKLQEFQSSFFGSLGAASKKIDDATGASTIKALTKDNPMMGFVAEYLMKRGNLGGLVSQNNPNSVDSTAPKSEKLGLK